ncbi:hypothetical protein EGH21_14925 [Halomicroarcula sp. F13]|uniref:Right handed beta helix domain-containing protein n=1 Tax=Haloarcula rubra TaxID=2487747 RepID=A0AAW4PT17_9EURY|nr:hypothetical protein [Halomicroarcula rubra]MBX0324321.1 hypothetical protein [Halomicroarcula rubra]
MESTAVAREFDGDVDFNGNDILDVGTIRGGTTIEEASIDSWNVVDVGELGVEPGSDTDLGAAIDQHFDRDDIESTMYYLSEGTYTWNTPVTSRSFEGFGIVGKPQARVRCTNVDMPYFISLGTESSNNADIFIARNVTFDINKENVAASAILASVDEYLEIDNCELDGQIDRIVPPFYSFVPTLLSESGTGYVSLTMTDGSFFDPGLNEQSHPMGLAIEGTHKGYLIVENTDIEGFVNNGIYSAGHNGKVAIRNTSIKNCGAGMLRLGDGDYAYKCALVNDDAEDRGYSYAALWVTNAEHAVADSIKIVSRQSTPSELVRVNSDADHCELTNIDIRSEANQYIFEFTGSGQDTGQVVASNWTITDTGSAQSNAQLGRIARPNVILENWDLTIDPAGDGKRHGPIVDAPWVDIKNCTFTHTDGGFGLLLDDDADYLRLKDCDFQRGQLFQYSRATTENAIVADNRFMDGTTLAGEQVNWTTRGPGYE